MAARASALAGLVYTNYSFADEPHVPGLALLLAQAGDKAGARKAIGQAIDEALGDSHENVIGRRREAYRLGGKAYDRVYMECLATEFQGRSGTRP